MALKNAGQMVENWYFELKNKYPEKNCRQW
jgi:hypothetical protein